MSARDARRIVSARVELIRGVLAQPLTSSKGTWRRREGCLFALHDGQGRVGWGEASPLPDYSSDSLDDARRALENVNVAAFEPVLVATDVAAALGVALGALMDGEGGALVRSPSARFALEAAVLDLAGQQRGLPLEQLLGPEDSPATRSAALACAALVSTFDADGALMEASQRWAQGYRALKFKLTREWGAVLELATELRRRWGSALELRFDANQGFEAHDALSMLAALRSLAPAFVEEPVRPDDWVQLQGCGVPLALDESLQGENGQERLEQAIAQQLCQAVVLKPMALGGLLRARALAEFARQRGVPAVVSHLLDGPVAMTAYRALAATLKSPLAHGLAPHAGLAALQPPPNRS